MYSACARNVYIFNSACSFYSPNQTIHGGDIGGVGGVGARGDLDGAPRNNVIDDKGEGWKTCGNCIWP